MMLKFKPEDFDSNWTQSHKAAQQIFDTWIKENGKAVYGRLYPKNINEEGFDIGSIWNTSALTDTTHKALLINIELIEKCTHPKEKVKWKDIMISPNSHKYGFMCDCGSEVIPREFEEMK